MKQYSAYKDSGIEWIGRIPILWGIVPIRALCYLGRGRVISNEEIANKAGEYPVYSSQTSEDGLMGRLNTYDFDGEYVTWTTDGANAGTVFHRQGKFNCTNVCGTLKAKAGKVFLKYLPYVLNLGTKCYVRYDINPKLMNNEMAGIRIPLPTITEQENISEYLDLKTAQIDDLITKKERMIELLKEERTAIINQAVTKGLNYKAEMKDSCIEWLGKVPKHWEIKRLKYVANINTQKPDGISDEAKVVFIAMESMNADGTYDNSIVRSYAEVKSGFTYFAEGDVIFAKITPCFENGKGALLHNLGTPIGFGSTEFHVLRAAKSKTISEYLYFLTISGLFRGLGEAFMQGVAGQKRVTNDFVHDFIIGVPPVDEQMTISTYLEEKIKRIDMQIGRGNKSIEYLKEYRTSLISEVVTGKIDVRG